MKFIIVLTINNPFEQGLIDKGYNIYNYHDPKWSRLFQRCIKDDIGKKYYINVLEIEGHHWWGDYNNRYQPEIQVDITHDNSRVETITIKYHSDLFPNQWRVISTLDDIENFFEKIFTNLNADYSEKYEEN